jgi:serine/threonine-protein phosphatase PP1 catalytic subunit
MDPRKKRLEGIINDYLHTKRFEASFTISDAQWLCQSVTPIFLSEPTLLRLQAPINICGDVHGQLADLLRCLEYGGLPPLQTWLLLGDYVDRGPKSVEVICLLFALKIRYPQHIYLLRGNHESVEMTEVFGFAHECFTKLNAQTWALFCKVFDCLPLAAVISNAIFCVHGGISPSFRTLAQIDQISRPLKIPTAGFITDLLWSDPARDVVHFAPSDRGSTVLWGLAPARQFLKGNGLQKIVRAHQVVMNGYEFPFKPDESVVTVFTASDYAIEMHNKAAFLVVSDRLTCDFRILQPVARSGVVASRGRSFSLEVRPTESKTIDKRVAAGSGPLVQRSASTARVRRSDSGVIRTGKLSF